jgi:DNA topoisomerase I
MALADEHVEAAQAAGLRYVTDSSPGIRRRRRGRGFAYTRPDGTPLRDASDLERIRKLVIPPRWTDVWICTSSTGHLQVTARDLRGRKQYRYHPRYREVRDDTKFSRMLEFSEVLPSIRHRVEQDISAPTLSRHKVLATVVWLLEKTLIRVGSDEYARDNGSFGLTTLRRRHVEVNGAKLRFEFRGKSGVPHAVAITDRRIARIVQHCQELPGQELFQYVDEAGEVRDVASDDVNDYLREIAGADFSAKDFRTWAGTVLAYRALRALQPADTETAARRNVVAAIRETAGRLGNTPAVARKSYVHPAVLEAYLDGRVGGALVEAAEEQSEPPAEATPEEEDAVVDLLRQRLDADASRATDKRPRSRSRR